MSALGFCTLLAFPSLGLGATTAISAEAPSGFEGLLAPQRTLVDLYYGGVRVGGTMAEYSPGQIRFLTPGSLADLVPRLIGRNAVLAVLKEAIPANADRTCEDRSNPRCGRLAPDVIGVIFDEARFRAEVFVNPAYLAADGAIAGRYLPPPAMGPSMTGTLSGVIAGADRGRAAFTLQGDAIAAIGAARVEVDLAQSSMAGLEVQTLAASLDQGALHYQAGLQWSPGQDLVGQGRYYGLGVSTQLDTLANRGQVTANPILIYLPAPSQVDILRAGRLLASQQYDAGNQLLDTSALPDGAYTVTLRIREAGGFTREETRTINKTRDLPPQGLPQYFLVGGLLAKNYASGLPSAAGAFLEGGYARRLSLATGVDATLALVASRAFLEVGATYIAPNGLRFRAAALGGSQGGLGGLLSSSITVGASTLSLEARQGWEARSSSPATPSPDWTLDPSARQSAFGLGLQGSQFSGTYGFALGGAQYRFGAAYTAAPFAKASHSFGPSVDLPFHIGAQKLRFLGQVAATERGVQGFFGFRLQFNQGRRSVYGDAGVSAASGPSGRSQLGPQVNLAAAMDADTALGDQTSTVRLTAGADDRATVSASEQLRGDRGDFTAELDHDVSGYAAGTRYSAGFVVGAALNPAASAIGSASGGSSGVIIDVQGAPPGSEFEVLINNAPRARIKAGERRPIMLPPFRAYAIRLAPRSSAALDFDTASRNLTLYPGDVRVLSWTAQKVIDVFGRVLDEAHRPVAAAVVQGGRYPSLTDDNGYFQTEVVGNAKLEFDRPGSGSCEVAVSSVTLKTNRVALGTAICRTVLVAQDKAAVNIKLATSGTDR